MVVEKLEYNSCQVKVHRIRNLTIRNRQHLKKIGWIIPEEKLNPQSDPEVEAVPKETMVDSTERFVAIKLLWG